MCDAAIPLVVVCTATCTTADGVGLAVIAVLMHVPGGCLLRGTSFRRMLLLLQCCFADMQMPLAMLAVGRSGQYMFAAASVAALRVDNVTIELCRCSVQAARLSLSQPSQRGVAGAKGDG